MQYIILFSVLIYFSRGSFAAPRKPRLSLVENDPPYFVQNIDGIPGTYNFGYDTRDPETGNYQFRTEERYPNSSVIGLYGYKDALGLFRNYKYIADTEGFRVFKVKQNEISLYEPTDVPFRPPYRPTGVITWTRPKNTKKKRPVNPLANNAQVHKRPQEFNLIGPPSIYVEY